jgi:PLP dependent protein
MKYEGLGDRLEQVRRVIAEHQRRGGFSHPVRIVAVTKGHEKSAVEAAVAAGLTDVGENRVQEALAKQAALPDVDVAWHLIGSLQRNKARQAVGRFRWIHSEDRPDLATELARRTEPGTRQRVLIEVNCSGEEQKGGVAPDGVLELVRVVAAAPTLEFGGLMTMAAFTSDTEVQRAAFARLRRLKESIEGAGFPVTDLSMGMSGDYPVAVEEGATMVRLGTVLFGERPQ